MSTELKEASQVAAYAPPLQQFKYEERYKKIEDVQDKVVGIGANVSVPKEKGAPSVTCFFVNGRMREAISLFVKVFSEFGVSQYQTSNSYSISFSELSNPWVQIIADMMNPPLEKLYEDEQKGQNDFSNPKRRWGTLQTIQSWKPVINDKGRAKIDLAVPDANGKSNGCETGLFTYIRGETPRPITLAESIGIRNHDFYIKWDCCKINLYQNALGYKWLAREIVIDMTPRMSTMPMELSIMPQQPSSPVPALAPTVPKIELVESDFGADKAHLEEIQEEAINLFEANTD